MEIDDDYSLMNVVRHMKFCMQKNSSKYHLVLQYKFAKPNEQTEGNKKFQKILEKSFKDVIVMNANRQMKKKPYVHLKSMTYPDQFKWFEKNLESLQNVHKIQKKQIEKLDLNTNQQKITYDSQLEKWCYTSRHLLFRPNYQAVKNGKLFRISLNSEAKGNFQPKQKVKQVLEEAIQKQLSLKQNQKLKKLQQTKQNESVPLRFKKLTIYSIDQYFDIYTSQIFQVSEQKMYFNILNLVKNKKGQTKQMMAKMILSEIVKEILHQETQYTYEVQLKFKPEIFQDFQEMQQEQIYEVMQKIMNVFSILSRDPHQFSADEVLNILKWLDSK